ncbi:MAG: alkaline shock response membrane anchor protein AmaP [Candidatus Omnitrophica bacterium]|nr:alkaline shock response membrane anchor protein AmaP [Candidatus Omnitrophota bacterium]
MKLINIFVHVIAIFAFLTIGSLMIIVSLHVLSMEDALLKVQEVYENPWQSFQMGVTGVLFIFVGLIFSKMLVKGTRKEDDLVLYGKWGYLSVSIRAINDLVRRVLRKFDVVREIQLETDAQASRLKIVANLSVLSGWNLPELIHAIQSDLTERLNKMLGGEIELELIVNVIKIIEQPMVSGRV